MLDPITKKVEDHSDEKQFSFSFYCAVCQHPWHSVPINFSGGRNKAGPEACAEQDRGKTCLWEKEHEAAYERANREAMLHFNRCPICKQWVCDDCFHMDESGDACEVCFSQAAHRR